MDKVIVTRAKIIDIADAIREKASLSEAMTLEEMADNVINMVTKGAVISELHTDYKCEVVE